MSNTKAVRLQQDCRLTNIIDCRDALLDAFGRNADIHLDLSRVAHVDISLVQLLVSAGKTAQKKKRVFKLTGAPPVVEAAIRSAGLDPGAMSHHPA